MIEPKMVVVDGMKFQLTAIPALKALKLDKTVVQLLVPIFGGVQGMSLDQEIDMSAMAKGLATALTNMDNEDMVRFFIDLFIGVKYLEDGAAPQEMSAGVIDRIFTGMLISMYKLAFEVMKFNKFSPFVLVGGGNVIKAVFSSGGQNPSQTKTGTESEKSGPSLL